MGPLPEFGMKGTTVIDDIDINFESVQEELAKLNCFKCMGPDAIHQKVLKGAGGGGGGLHQNSLEIDLIVISGRRE